MYVYPPNNYQNLTNQSGSDLASIFILLAILIAVAAVSTGIYYGVKAFNSTNTSPTSTNTCEKGKTYDTVYKKCLRTCPTGYEPIDDKDDCYIICEKGKTRCGKNECIDLSLQSCIDDKSCNIYNVRNYKENSVSKQECCKDNEYVNKVKDSSDQICSTCDNTICGDKCCPKEIRLVNPSSKDPFDTELFENKNPGPICVNSSICCDQNFISSDGKCCQTPLCGTNKKCCADNERCVEGECKTICGDTACSKDTEVCVDNGLGSQKCIPKGCPWLNISYDPSRVSSYFTNENKPAFYTNHDSIITNKYVIPTCSVINSLTNTPLYVTKGSSSKLLQSRVMSTLEVGSNPKCQDPLACFNKIYEKGVTSVNDFSVLGNNCSGKMSCDTTLPKISDIQNECPIRNVDGTFSSQCCGDPNNFKGEVCPDSQICFYDKDDGLNKCYSAGRDEYNKSCNGGRASVNNKQIVCDCSNLGIDVKFLNKDCSKLLIKDYYNDDWIKNHVDNILKMKYNNDNTISSVAGWEDFLIILINCENLTYIKWNSSDKTKLISTYPKLDSINISDIVSNTNVSNPFYMIFPQRQSGTKNYYISPTNQGDYISSGSWTKNRGLSFQLKSKNYGTYYNCIFNINPGQSPPWYKVGGDQGYNGNWRNNTEIMSNIPEHSKLYQPDWYGSYKPTIFVVYGSEYADGSGEYY